MYRIACSGSSLTSSDGWNPCILIAMYIDQTFLHLPGKNPCRAVVLDATAMKLVARSKSVSCFPHPLASIYFHITIQISAVACLVEISLQRSLERPSSRTKRSLVAISVS